MSDWMLRGARLRDDEALHDIYIANGRIAALGSQLAQTATNEWDLAGRIVLPGFVDIHAHLDKTYSTIANQSGTLQEAIDIWTAYKKTRTPQEVRIAVEKALRSAIASGVTALRSHLNVEDEGDLPKVENILALRDAWRDQIDLQFVALGYPGWSATCDAVILEALEMGVDCIGGAPALLDDPHASIDAAFALAERTGRPIDLHIDETEDPTTLTLAHLAEQTIAHGMQGRVTAGHCCSLSFADAAHAGRVMDRVAEAQIHIVTLPSCNLVLMGRAMQPAPRGVTPVKALLARGVNVCAASDNVHDPFNPFGAYDPLQIANLNAHVAHMTGAAELYTCLEMVTTHAARAFGAAPSRIEEGAAADLVVVDAPSVLEAVTHPPPRLATFKAGKLIVRTAIERTWYGEST